MKKIILSFVFVMINIAFVACNHKSETTNLNYESLDNKIVENKNYYEEYQNWFTEFENKYPNWIDSKQGLRTFKSYLDSTMLNNLNFVKSISYIPDDLSSAVASSNREINIPHILLDDSMGKSTNTNTGETGELKVFLIELTFNLSKPLYNGQKTIDIVYEIISFIPATEENHHRPYINNTNKCIKAKSKYFSNYNISDKILGTYIIN